MKRKLGIVSLVAALILAVSCILSIIATAEATVPALSIKGKNLSFSDSVYIIFYVDAENVEHKDIKLLIWNEAQTSYTVDNSPQKLSYVGSETLSGKEYARFEYRDLAAKNMADTVYARAYVSQGGKDYYSDLTNYSILQYAYNKLGYTGNASTDEAFKSLLIDMLEYGAAAQLKFNHKTDRLATSDFKQITAVGGVLPDKCNRGFFLKDETVVITAVVPEGKVFSCWRDEEGKSVSTSPSYEVTVGSSNATYTAEFTSAS